MEDIKDANLKNQTAFTYQKTLLGIPDKVFVITALLAGFGCVLIFKLTPYYLAIPLCGAFLLMLFRPLIVIHQHDPHAWQLWMATLWSPNYFSTQYTSSLKRNIIIIKDEKILSINDINGKNNEKH